MTDDLRGDADTDTRSVTNTDKYTDEAQACAHTETYSSTGFVCVCVCVMLPVGQMAY